MTSSSAERLYALLPQVVRLRDQESGGALQELLTILAADLDVLAADLDQFYADQFIETSADWVVPYIGDLIGYRMVSGRAPNALSPRAEVANTIRYRRRKGTASMIEQLARDVTDWPARAVEFFERLATTQYLNHLRPQAQHNADLRQHQALAEATRLAGAFDDLAHTADVRRIAAASPSGRGRYNIPNLGIFLFRTLPMPIQGSVLRPEGTDGQRFRFDPLGTDSALFTNPVAEDEITHLAEPANVPFPLTVRWFAEKKPDPTHLEYYSKQRGVLLEIVDSAGVSTEVPVTTVVPSDLRDVGATWANQPAAGQVAIDPERGRVYFGTPVPAGSTPLGTFYLGQAVPVGARTAGRTSLDQRRAGLGIPATLPQPVFVAHGGGALQTHLNDVRAGGTLQLQDSARWTPSPEVKATPPAGHPAVTVAVVADPSARPVLYAPSGVRLTIDPGSTVLLDGIVVEGGPVFLDEVDDGQERTIVLVDCTLVPGGSRTTAGKAVREDQASLIVLDPFATVVLDGCITGPIVLVEGARLVVNGSVVDATKATNVAMAGREGARPRKVTGPADYSTGDGSQEAGELTILGSTVVGGIHGVRLDATDSILLAELKTDGTETRTAAILTQRRQVGCIRFCWLPTISRTGRRFRCQPDRTDPITTQQRTVPSFTSLRFGDPAYAQLSATTPDSIRRGASDESEMGATHDMYAPQREDDVVARLEEYLRYGLEAGIFYAT